MDFLFIKMLRFFFPDLDCCKINAALTNSDTILKLREMLQMALLAIRGGEKKSSYCPTVRQDCLKAIKLEEQVASHTTSHKSLFTKKNKYMNSAFTSLIDLTFFLVFVMWSRSP